MQIWIISCRIQSKVTGICNYNNKKLWDCDQIPEIIFIFLIMLVCVFSTQTYSVKGLLLSLVLKHQITYWISDQVKDHSCAYLKFWVLTWARNWFFWFWCSGCEERESNRNIHISKSKNKYNNKWFAYSLLFALQPWKICTSLTTDTQKKLSNGLPTRLYCRSPCFATRSRHFGFD